MPRSGRPRKTRTNAAVEAVAQRICRNPRPQEVQTSILYINDCGVLEEI